MVNDIVIGNKKIGNNYPPFLIAEMSGNHNQSLEKALSIIDAAALCGADAVKIQTYTPDTLTIDVSHGEFFISDPHSLWEGRSLYDLYSEAYTPWEWHKAIFERAAEKGIMCFSTPFDETSVDFLESLDVPAYKIASFENNHLPLLRKVAKTGKPVIMSTGIASLSDLDLAVKTLKDNGCKDLMLLKCTSTYPATPENTNLVTIPHMKDLFQCEVGLSDHTMGIGASLAAVALGAKVVEKHFTLDRSEGGVDSTFSLEPNEFQMLVEESKRAFLSLGKVTYGILEAEKNSLSFKRSIYIVEDMEQGEYFSEKNIRIIRPGLGLSPKYFEIIVGKKISRSAKRGTALQWDMLS